MKLGNKLKRLPYRGFKRDRFRVITREGINYLVNYKNSIDRKLIVDGGYEKEQLACFSSLIKEHACTKFYDVGANIGLYTVNIARLPSIKEVVAFEPTPANICQLKANLLLNHLHNEVEVLPFGLSDREDTVEFLENTGNSTGRSRIKATNKNELDSQKFIEKIIQVRPLDSLTNERGVRLAIKIDVEGHEEQALKGMSRLLEDNHCVLQIESYDQNSTVIEELLSNKGYRLIREIGVDRYYSPLVSPAPCEEKGA